MSNDAEFYKNLLPSQSRFLERFPQVIEAITAGSTTIQRLFDNFPSDFDIDTAMGPQLDIIGQWVGLSRVLPVPISGVYFEWDGADAVGWDKGLWQGPFDPDTGPVLMSDDNYRRLLRVKILVNHWDGSMEQLSLIWNAFLPPDSPGIIIDGQDMTLSFGFEGADVTGVDLAILNIALSLIKPSAVRIRDVFSATAGEPLFAWDTPGGGWGEASWSTLINV